MTDNSPKNSLQNMNSKQKAMIGVFVLIFLVIIWQVVGMLGGDGSDPVPQATNGKTGAMNQPSGQPAGMVQQAQLPQTQRQPPEVQAQLAKLQLETQQNYVVALNQLQMLKLSQEIADANKGIAAAKLDTVKAQKEIVELLTKPATPVESPRNYSQDLANPFAAGRPQQPEIQGVTPPPETTDAAATPTAAPKVVTTTQSQEDTSIANYVVVSVSELMHKWNAVLGYQGRLYSVSIGDVMPVDGAVVKSIDKYSVVLEKGTAQRKVSLVPII